jgi:hypothetical protein
LCTLTSRRENASFEGPCLIAAVDAALFPEQRASPMGLRTFVAPDGDEWRVWKVIPTRTLEDVREWERRGQDVLAYAGPERRADERRESTTVPFVSPTLAKGWLCVESPHGKRRLAPPPAAWEDSSEAELTALWAQAEIVPPRTLPVSGIAQPAS